MAFNLFITGTDTNVGKTIVASALSKRYNAYYWKPIQSGYLEEGSDSDFVASIIGDKKILPEVYKLKKPLAPILAADDENIVIDLIKIKKIFKKLPRPLIIEGAGGLFVPLNKKELVIDLISYLDVQVIIVARTSLGTINHTLLSIGALRSKKIKLMGVVLMGKKDPGLEEVLIRFGKIKILGSIPFAKKINSESIFKISKMIRINEEIL